MWACHKFFGPGQILVWPDQKLLPDLVLGPKTTARCGPTHPGIVRWPKLVAARTSFLDQMPISTGHRTNLPKIEFVQEFVTCINWNRVVIGMIELARVEIQGQACYQKMKILTS